METPDVDSLLANIREQVRLRRLNGDYPPGLEEELEAEFRGIVNQERRDWSGVRRRLEERVDAVHRAFGEVNGLGPTQSRIPGGSLLHRLVRKTVARQTTSLAFQVRHASAELVELVSLIAELQMSQEDADRRLVAHLSKSVLDRLAVVDHLAILVRDLERRVEK